MINYHEPPESLSNPTRDTARALHSLKEEIEAIDWYHQRVEKCSNAQLKKILEHNREEEIEHACALIEWLRKNMNGWDDNLKRNLFIKNDINSIES